MKIVITLLVIIFSIRPLWKITQRFFLSDTKMRIGIIAIVLTSIISIIMVCNLLDFDMYVKGIFCIAILWLTGLLVIILHNYYLEVVFRNNANNIPSEDKSFWYSINTEGVLGICLDDEWKFVLSRMLHLKMITHEEFMNYHNECFDLETDFGNSCVSYQIEAKLDIINLKKISFFIDEGKLNNIFIEIKDSTGIGDLLIKSNGKPNINDEVNDYCWVNNSNGHGLVYSIKENMIGILATYKSDVDASKK